MALDPRSPVVVGVAQTQRRPTGTVAGLASPAVMMAEALRLAGADSGSGDRLLRAADSLRVVDVLSWRYRDPASLVAPLIGAEPRERVRTTVGGDSPQTVVNEAAGQIAAGQLDVVLVAGAEAMSTVALAKRTGEPLEWERQGDLDEPTRVAGTDRPGTHPVERSRSLVLPIQVYPVFECAVRAAAGESVEAHQVRISELWSRFSEVAAANPHAWSPAVRSPEEVRTPTPDNRMIGFPYTKLMNANIQVDQAAALIVCSVEAARSAGVPEERWVFPHAGAGAADHWWVSERMDWSRSPALGACGRAVLGLAGAGIDDIAYVDLYSCFPSAVQVAASELGIDAWDRARVPTLTGGLGFAGGPGSNYVTHSLATLVHRLRADPGATGLVTALGWFITKHAVGIYSTTPPACGFRWTSVQDEVDARPRRRLVAHHEGAVTIEAYTAMHERDGSPALGIVAGLLDDGSRAWANTTDGDLLGAMVEEDLVGRRADFAGGQLRLG